MKREKQKMFDHIGSKIKTLAVIIAFAGMIASFALSFVSCSNDQTLIGFLILFVGSIGSLVGSFFMYGYGDLIEKVSNIERKICYNNQSEAQINWTDERIFTLERLREKELISEEDFQKALGKIRGE